MNAQWIMVIIIAVCLVALAIVLYKGRKNDIVMSIKESLDLCDLPVVTMMNDGKKYNFMLDTGSTDNHISMVASKLISGVPSENTLNVKGFNGGESKNQGYSIKLNYKDREFHIEAFVSTSLDNTFDWIKKDTGVQLHGIIGNKFLQEYGYILDFYNLKVYAKR